MVVVKHHRGSLHGSAVAVKGEDQRGGRRGRTSGCIDKSLASRSVDCPLSPIQILERRFRLFRQTRGNFGIRLGLTIRARRDA